MSKRAPSLGHLTPDIQQEGDCRGELLVQVNQKLQRQKAHLRWVNSCTRILFGTGLEDYLCPPTRIQQTKTNKNLSVL